MTAKVPTQLRLLRGNPGKRAIRPEPMPALLEQPPDPPDFLNETAKSEWWRIVNELHRLRLVTSLDVNILGAYCAAFARWYAAELMLAEEAKKNPETQGFVIIGSRGTMIRNPLLIISAEAAKEMLSYAIQFGLSPLARSRIAAGVYEGKPPGKFDGLCAS